MPTDDVLRNLESEANADIAWAFGDILRGWCNLPDWRTSVLLRQLEANNPNLAAWNELIRKGRRALDNEAELPSKAGALLAPRSAGFNDALDDFVAELLAAQYLKAHDHVEIHFLSEDDPIHTDFQSRLGGRLCVTEVKNLHEPVALTKIAFGRWNHNQAADPELYRFAAELSDLDDPLSDLTPEQVASVNILVDDLPHWKRPSRQIRTLPGGRRLSAKVRDEGHSVIVTHGGGPFRVDGPGGMVAKGQRGLTMKLLEHTRKALSQLYADQVPGDGLRLLYVRWKPPGHFVVAPEELADVRKVVQEGLRSFVSLSFPHFALILAHTDESPDQTPAVQWQ